MLFYAAGGVSSDEAAESTWKFVVVMVAASQSCACLSKLGARNYLPLVVRSLASIRHFFLAAAHFLSLVHEGTECVVSAMVVSTSRFWSSSWCRRAMTRSQVLRTLAASSFGGMCSVAWHGSTLSQWGSFCHEAYREGALKCPLKKELVGMSGSVLLKGIHDDAGTRLSATCSGWQCEIVRCSHRLGQRDGG